jgi:two-component system OmpR family sensor kinase
MFLSLRARLVAWSTALLLTALVTFGGWVALSTWRGWVAEVDRGLEARLASLTAAVQPAGNGAFDLVLPPNALTNIERDYYAVWDAQGRVLVSSDADAPMDRPLPGTSLNSNERERIAALPQGVTIMVGRRIDNLSAELRRLLLAMAGVGMAALLLVVAGGWWLIGRALAPVTRIGQTARAMIDGDLTARIPMSQVESELEDTAGALNEAFDRLFASLERQRRFTADASHDLRTPITTLQTEAHWALARPRSVEEYRASLQACQRAATRMEELVGSLLALARAESATTPDRVPCPLPDMVETVINDLQPQARAKHVSVVAGTVVGTVVADAVSLRAALTNLLANAIQYNVEGGSVHVSAGVSPDDPGAHLITVRDTGIGMAAHDAARVFDPFYRVDASRDRTTGGAGLGLAMVAAFARAHGGSVTVDSAAGQGSTFTLRLPSQRF